MKDHTHQAKAFKQVFEATMAAASIRQISFRPPLAGMDEDVANKFYKENLIYKLSFPRQVGKSEIIYDFNSQFDDIAVYSIMNKDTFGEDVFAVFVDEQLGKRIFVLDSFSQEDQDRLVAVILKKSKESGFYSPIIIVE